MGGDGDHMLGVTRGVNASFFTTIPHNIITTAACAVGSGKAVSENATFKVRLRRHKYDQNAH